MTRRPAPVRAALLAGAVVLTALAPIATNASTASAATSPSATAVAPIAWSPCANDPGYRCGTVRVPVDYEHPAGPSLSLAVIEKPATAPVGQPGVLLFNPGGPG
ncbi:MAG TPA: hypothetical protein VIJ60_11700, partial [Acidimicrobiales bacterium]